MGSVRVCLASGSLHVPVGTFSLCTCIVDSVCVCVSAVCRPRVMSGSLCMCCVCAMSYGLMGDGLHMYCRRAHAVCVCSRPTSCGSLRAIFWALILWAQSLLPTV